MKKILNAVKNGITPAMFAVISIIFFLIFPIQLRFYLLLVAALWLAVCCAYLRVENKAFLQYMIAGTAVNMGVYCIMKMMVVDWKKAHLDWVESLLAFVIILEWIVVFVGIRKKTETNPQVDGATLFREREYDLKRVKNYLFRVPLLGIDAAWGDGKSFLVKQLLNDSKIRERYENIQIDVLTCQLDEIEVLLFGELDKILKENRLFSKHSKQLKRMLGSQPLLEITRDLSMDEAKGTSAAFEGFKEDLEKLDKDILIIYDDLDRVSDGAVIDKILAISEKLAGKKIHILYLYDSSNLAKDKDFIEKYIPYQVKLTRMRFEGIVQGLWEELDMRTSGLDLEDVTKLRRQSLTNWSLNRKIGMKQMGVTMSIPWGNVRRVRIFLTELKIFLEDERNESGEPFTKEERQLLCKCFLVKNFMYDIYETFEVGTSPMESLKFTYQDEHFSLEELAAKVLNQEISKDELWQILMQNGNREAFSVLTMLGYEMIEDLENIKDVDKRREAIANEDENLLRRKEHNEKIDRTIWNVMANGVSEFTDIEAVVMRLCKDVLPLDKDKQQEAWEQLNQQAFEGKIWKNNITIFRMGIDSYLAVFQAMKVVGNRVTAQQWCQWIDFYFRQKENQKVYVEMVEALNYVNLNEKSVYIETLRHFVRCKVVGNLNGQIGFVKFIKQYIPAISYLGYADSYVLASWRYESCNLTEEEERNRMTSQLEQVKKALEKEKKASLLEVFCEELDIIYRFVTKCQRLIACEKSIKPRELRVDTKIRSVKQHQEEFDRLKKLKEQYPDRLRQELEESYKSGKINPSELRELMH